MPSMLGLTTDKSPHGLNSKEPFMGEQNHDNDDMGKQLARRAGDSLTKAYNGKKDKKDKKKSSRRKHSRRDSGHGDSEDDSDNDVNVSRKREERIRQHEEDDEEEGDRPNTIKERNFKAAMEGETLFWRALCDKPSSAFKYMGKDAVVSNYLLFGDKNPRGPKTEPTLEEALEDCEGPLSYRIHKSYTVEIGLMAVAVVYDVTLYRSHGPPARDGTVKMKVQQATVTSTWRQVASGDYVLASSMCG
ncbi:conserved hypothetical protein [Verticillium alfalfae VaMs.102]|uniref:DUF4440 domain-containing protein n=1 Tax=Verticillium alfalfae (strain VaMs.102 / ATCC MYA-4576 / FGSC 10136) TaxID=526221 RepID=C9SCE9_VERA1|nr:conserved hypothetical protein [Verticillium alfalfae VaMs.102]EEY16764.1 conserved hypothetical protein [Verticillium alfalfae VaMs.102]